MPVCLSTNCSLANSENSRQTYKERRGFKIISYLTCFDRSGVIFKPGPSLAPSHHISGTGVCLSFIAPFFGRCGSAWAVMADFWLPTILFFLLQLLYSATGSQPPLLKATSGSGIAALDATRFDDQEELSSEACPTSHV
jgi:hypothetical protein